MQRNGFASLLKRKKNKTTESIAIWICVHFFAVTGLPYPNHTHYSYMKVEGVCPEQYYYRSDELSEITCRFLCDTARESRKSARNLCSGYTHYEISAEDARLGTTVSECKLMSENCQPIRDGNRRAFTFIRQQTDSQTKDSVR